jgi:erythromycin esterase
MQRLHAAMIAACLAGCASPATDGNAPSDEAAVAEAVRANTVRLRTVEPDGGDMADLEAFGRAVGERRIVILGEPTHGDGDIFKLKARLVAYLHEAKGFDVLLMESGMFDVARMRERHAADGSPFAALAPGRMFFMYSRTEDGRRVLDYVDATQKTARPLALAGFDIPMGGDASAHELLPLLEEWLASHRSEVAKSDDWRDYRAVATRVVALQSAPRPQATQWQAFQRITARLDGELCAGQADDASLTRSSGFWCRMAHSIDAGAQRLWGPVDLRDRAGGDSASWLIEHPFAGKKVVLWMHSFHGINGQRLPPSGPGWVSVGTRLVQIYGDQVFMTHFSAGQGPIDAYLGAPGATQVPALRRGMLEHRLMQDGGPQFMAYPADAAARERLRGLAVFEADFTPTQPNHFGSGYQGLFFIPTTRAILPDADRYPLLP